MLLHSLLTSFLCALPQACGRVLLAEARCIPAAFLQVGGSLTISLRLSIALSAKCSGGFQSPPVRLCMPLKSVPLIGKDMMLGCVTVTLVKVPSMTGWESNVEKKGCISPESALC
jgi:hypothetical protein